MAKIKLPVYITSGSHPEDQTVALGEGLIKKWKVPSQQTVTLRFGSVRKEVRIVPSGSASIRMSEPLASRLGLHHGVHLTAAYRPSTKTLVLGPLIGVLVSRVYSGLPDRPFGAMTPFCRELTDACELYGGFVYFFTPEDLSAGTSSVPGWVFHGRWTKRTMPAPDVLYNRLTSRKLENKPIVQHFMRDVKSRYNAVVFNERYLNKTDVFQALRNESALSGLLPESYLFKNFAMLKSMCNKYQNVFLKPVTGSLGKGIIRITRPAEGGYQVSYTSLGGVRKINYSTLTQLFSSISSQMKAKRYQIQQGLKLMEVGGRPVDFRALVQRNQQGQWAITSVMARIAANNTFVSNLARGGTLSTVSEAVAKSNLPPSSRSSVGPRLRNAAVNIAKGIENQMEGHFAELGVDLAVDSGGRVWLLEVNSKPSKDDNTPNGDGKIRPSVKQLVHYSQYAAGLR
ncbi:YheC/YheD family endospore coat-associated protein [Gorillibacterium sp. sgz5001074]|uniref:YheC/YheD family endospore coat-associated protein n=1 Tax=Gorillibacterium sp. sgz5001074 TaxID=3446695 RepID=UPI003F66A1EF